jgi:uncharacterized Zn finger protein
MNSRTALWALRREALISGAAWTAVLAGNLAGSLSPEQAREQLAKRIMRAVDQGDTDQERLTLIAIKFFDSRVQAD